MPQTAPPPTLDFEAIAETIHEYYHAMAKSKGWTEAYPVSYPNLPEYMKASNRAAARRIRDVLALAGLTLVLKTSDAPTFSDDEIRQLLDQDDIREVLAEGVHDGWVETMLKQGWRLGDPRNDELRVHPLLKPYAALPETQKDKDRNSLSKYPDIIAQTVYRISTANPA